MHPQGGFAVEVQAAPGANHFPLVVTEADGTVTTKYVDLLVENSIPVIHTYDLNGNLESVAPQATPGSPTRTYQWDAVNRLVGITRILSPTETRKTEFLYNGAGARVGKKELLNNVVESDIRYIYSGTGVLQERSADGGTVLKTYTSQGEQSYLTINHQLSTINLYHTRDHLGSVREVVAEDGTLVARYDYKPYGKRVQVSGTYDAAKGYTGHDYHAASDLILTRYRAYDPGTGRWLSPDPLGESGGMNLYGYVMADPVNAVDPDGMILQFVLAAGNGNTGFERWLGDTLHNNFGTQGSDSYVDGVARSSAAMMDGIIPFADPMKARGDYDPCDNGMELSYRGGEYAQDLAVAAVGGKLLGKGLQHLEKSKRFGIGSQLLGRGGKWGYKGIWNSGEVRVGWSWKQSIGGNVIRIAVGRTPQWAKGKNAGKIIDWARHVDFW